MLSMMHCCNALFQLLPLAAFNRTGTQRARDMFAPGDAEALLALPDNSSEVRLLIKDINSLKALKRTGIICHV